MMLLWIVEYYENLCQNIVPGRKTQQDHNMDYMKVNLQRLLKIIRILHLVVRTL